MDNFSQIIKVLRQNEIEFVLIGGLAAVAYGSSQVTQDIDICIEFHSNNLEKLRNCLKDFHPIHRMTQQKLSFLEHPESLDKLKNLYLETDIGALDILSSVIGVGSYQDLMKNAKDIELFGEQCKIISIQDLINSKIEMARFKDKIVAQELMYILKKKSEK